MAGYVYILSNASMPGLLKVGKTTTSPNQRMSELHTTGVPTPFELEFCAQVENCHEAEALAHARLARFRVSNSREFFRVTQKVAIESILPSLGSWSLHSARETYGIADLAAVENRRKQERDRHERREQVRREAESRREREAREAKLDPLLLTWQLRKHQLHALGPKPQEAESGWDFFIFCYLPAPVGWLLWACATQVFSAKHQAAGWFAVALIVIGFLANRASDTRRARHQAATKPWTDLENELTSLRDPLKKLGADPDSIPMQAPAPTSVAVQRRVHASPPCPETLDDEVETMRDSWR